MGRKKLGIAEKRSFQVMVKFKPQVKEEIMAAMQRNMLKRPKENTISAFVRRAVWEFCKPSPDDPREP